MNPFPLTDRTQLLLEDILYFEGEGNYTFVYYRSRPAVLLSKSIGFLMERLPEGMFVRISRKYVIHGQEIPHLILERAKRTITFSSGTQLPVARRRMRELKAIMGVTKNTRQKKTTISMVF